MYYHCIFYSPTNLNQRIPQRYPVTLNNKLYSQYSCILADEYKINVKHTYTLFKIAAHCLQNVQEIIKNIPIQLIYISSNVYYKYTVLSQDYLKFHLNKGSFFSFNLDKKLVINIQLSIVLFLILKKKYVSNVKKEKKQ